MKYRERTNEVNKVIKGLWSCIVDLSVRRRKVGGDSWHGEAGDICHVRSDTRQNVTQNAERQ